MTHILNFKRMFYLFLYTYTFFACSNTPYVHTHILHAVSLAKYRCVCVCVCSKVFSRKIFRVALNNTRTCDARVHHRTLENFILLSVKMLCTYIYVRFVYFKNCFGYKYEITVFDISMGGFYFYQNNFDVRFI